jgi:unsaturated rhamnogalacturonyl hydrolase
MEIDRSRSAGSPAKPGKDAGLALARSIMSSYVLSDASWHYENALLILAARSAGDAWGDDALSRGARAVSSGLVGPDGKIRGYKQDDYNLDMINAGRNLIDLFAETGEARLKIAIETLAKQLRSQPRTPSGGFWHKLIYPNQMWLDGLYMAEPFAARYAAAFGDRAFAEDAVAQFILMAEKARDPRTGLLKHAWDEKRTQLWADPETGRSPNYWGRAMGWYAMALVDVYEVLPADIEGRAELEAILAGLAESLAGYQDPESGLWYQVVDQGDRAGNYLEASVSSMLPYAFMKGVRLGLLDASRFLPAARKAYEGACARFLRRYEDGSFHLEGTCSVAGLGGSPYRDGSFEYYIGEKIAVDDFKGVGSFILCSVEYEALK